MSLPSIGPKLLESVMRRTTHSEVESREDVLRGICSGLFQSGAQHVRYYDIGIETVPGLPREKTLYLTWQEAAPGQPTGRKGLGYRIPFESASISRQAVQEPDRTDPLLHPIQCTPEDHPATWVGDLDLHGRTWIDVAIYDHERLVGVLAFDWHGPTIEWNSTTTTILLLLGQLVGAQIEAAAPRVETELRQRVRELYREGSKQHPIDSRLLQKAVHFFQEVVRVSSVSIFRYDWARQALVRESISTLDGPNESPAARTMPDVALGFGAEVFEVGSKLTGLAWKSRDYRRILDFRTLQDRRPDLISAASMDFHIGHVGQVESVMYGIVGDRDQRYLLRMINNYDHPGLPFLAQFDLLNRFLGDLAPLIDSQAAEVRATVVRWVQERINKRAGLDVLFDTVVDALETAEGLKPVGVIAQREAQKPHLFFGASLDRISQVRDDVTQSKAYRDSVNAKAGIRTTKASSLRIRSDFFPGFSETADVATLALESGGTRGIILFPIVPGGRTPSDGANSFLTQIASLMAQGIEQDYAASQTQGALQALALVGHEMATPLAAMSQLGQRAVQVARQQRDGIVVGVGEDLNDLGERLRYQAETLEAAIRLGHIVGRQSEGRLVGVFQKSQMSKLINRAIYRTRGEIASGLLIQPRGGIRLLRPTGIPNLYANCDAPLLEAALINLYRNAVKYSLERSTISTIETDVARIREERQAYIAISITNWGIPIPNYHEDLIFNAFTRFAIPVAEVTRRGMGLGLYLTRQIARAHQGAAFLKVHEAEINDSPRDGPQIYKTTFTITIRRDLPLGPYDRSL